MSMEVPDFDVLLALHRHDPQALEQLRRHLLRESVASAPVAHRQSLEHLLTRIEAARETAADPMEAALIAFRMMRDSMEQLHGAWGLAFCAVAGMHASLLIERARR